MFLKTLFILFTCTILFADKTFKSNYYIDSNKINISDIIPQVKNDKKLFMIDGSKYTKRVKSKDLIELLQKSGYMGYTSKHRYVKFTKKSPIDTSKIEEKLVKIYKEKYPEIKIKSIEVRPRAYLTALPDKYTVFLQPKQYLKSSGVVSIKSDSKKQLFFNYSIDATIEVYKSRKNIKRNSELSNVNCVKKSIILDRFRAMPIQELVNGRVQSKNHIKINRVLTRRDVKELELITRGSTVNVLLSSDNIDISFSGEALQSGVYGDTIKVRQSNSKVLKVRIVGKNRGEVL